MARLPWQTLLAKAALATALVSCTGKDPMNPGTPLGTFHVMATLTGTTCGTVPNPWEFDVRLAHEGAKLYWIQGGAPIAGDVDATSRAALRATDTRTLREADAKKRVAACAVSREDVLDVVLAGADGRAAATATATAFKGKLAYGFSPVAGSDCDDQLSAAGGDFDALPCTVTYELSAQQVAGR